MLVDYGHSTQHAAARVLWIDDGARCWENAFQVFGSAQFFCGRTQTPAWASQLWCSQGWAPHDMVCPPKPKILAMPLINIRCWCCRHEENVQSALTVVFVSDAADDDDAFPALDVGTVEWNLMNDNPYGIICQHHIQFINGFKTHVFVQKAQLEMICKKSLPRKSIGWFRCVSILLHSRIE